MHALLSAQSYHTSRESRCKRGNFLSGFLMDPALRSDLPRNDNYFRRTRRRRNARLTHVLVRCWFCVETVATLLTAAPPSSDNTKRVERNVFATKQLCLRSPRPYLRHWREGLIVNCIFLSFSRSRLSFNRTPFGCKRFAGGYIRSHNEQGSCIACDCSTVSKNRTFAMIE